MKIRARFVLAVTSAVLGGCGGGSHPAPKVDGGDAARADAAKNDAAKSDASGTDATVDGGSTVLRLIVSPATQVVAVAEGAQATFTVVLSRAPAAPVTVTVTSSNAAVATASPATLTFNATNFATAQTVTVEGVQDADTANATATLTLAATGVTSVPVRVDVTDDDVQGIQATPSTLTVTEGMTGLLNVRLAAAPAADVTIAVASATPAKATVSPATLTFTAANFATPQAVTVTTLQDPDVTDDMVDVSLTSTGLVTVTVPVTVTDDDRQGITVTPAAVSVTEGSTAPAVFQVHLNQMPSSPVTVNLASLNPAAASVSPATMTFTAANYAIDQTASVLAVDDDNTIGESTSINVTSAGLTDRAVTVAVTDNDTQAVVTAPTSVAVTEGGTSTFSVRLAFNPSSAVTVSIATSNATKATTTVTSLSFTAANYATPQTVTVQGQADDDLANDTATLTLSSPGSTNVTVPVTIADDDTQALIVTPTTVGVVEGSSSTFTARLAFRPAAAVTVTATSNATVAATVAPASLTFDAGNFATPQTFTISGVADVNVIDETATVTVASTGVPSIDVHVTVTDDDRQAILANPPTLALTEGAGGTLQVRLNFAPSAVTTVTLTSSNPKVTAAPATLTFGPGDFATTQPATVSAATDLDAIGETANLTLSAAGITDSVVPVTVTDIDTQTHVVAPVALMVMEQDPTGGTFDVHLNAQPVGNVTVTVASSAPGSAAVSPSTLTFTPGNYGVNQTVTVRGLADANLTDERVTIAVSSAVAPTASVMVLVQEDDLQDLVVTPANDVLPNAGSLVVVEDAPTPATIGVSLAFQPGGTKGVRVQSNGASVLINGQPIVDLIFTTTNYATPQFLTVTTPSDNNLDQPADTTVTVNLCDTACNSSTFSSIKTVSVDAREDDVQRIITSLTNLPIGENPTAGGVFTARLAFEPLAGGSETVTVSSSDTGAATVSPATLMTFTAANYNLPQMIAVTGVDDADVNNEVVTATLTSSFAGAPDATVTVNVTDDDTQALIVSSNSADLQEPPGTPIAATFTVRLQFDPAGTLAVALASPDPGAVTVSPPTLTFNSANYMLPQTVTVTAVSDEDVRDETVAVTASAPGGVQPVTFTVRVADDDQQGLVTSATATVIEEGIASVPVHLQFRPTADLAVSATITGTAGKATVSGPLTFTPANYASDQSFTLTGLTDADLDDVSLSLTLSVISAQGATPPEGAGPVVIPLTVLDNDVQSMVVHWVPADPFVNSVQELGPGGSFQVHLAFPPRGPGDDIVGASLSPALIGHGAIVGESSLVFTDANFAVDQTLRFSAIADADALDDLGSVQLLIFEAGDPSGPNDDVTADAPVRLIDRARGVIGNAAYPSLFGGTQFTERGNIQWGATSFLVSGHDPSGVFSVGRDDRDLGGFTGGLTVGTANADNSTQAIEWNGANFGVFVSDRLAGAVRYTQVAPELTMVGASTTLAPGAAEFWVTHNTAAHNYAVLFRAPGDNLSFSLVQYDGTASSPQTVTSPDASPDRTPNIHYVGGTTGLDYVYSAVATPYAGLYTTAGGLVCIRLTATGALVPGGSTFVNNVPDFYSSAWTGAKVAAAHAGTGGLDIELIGLSSGGVPCTQTTFNALGNDSYVNTPSVAYNGVDIAVGYDVRRILDPVAGTAATFVGVFLYNPTANTSSNRLFNATGDVPGERPSLTWAGDRWILRYSSAAGVQVRTGSLTP